MKVLFVCRGRNGISPIVAAQADSLVDKGVGLELFSITGNGFRAYMASIPKLRKKIAEFDPDIVHSHYSLCGFVCAVSTSKPIVASLMGSDVVQSGMMRAIIKWFVTKKWDATIVKSLDMKTKIGISSLHVIPNGVNFSVFKPMDKLTCKHKLAWDETKTQLLFAADPKRIEKNYGLAIKSCERLNDPRIELKVVYGIAQYELPIYLNAADLVLLTSLWEGSPNIVKEAMACNTPVVSTNVGDVQMLFGDTEGYLLVGQDINSVSFGISKILMDKPELNGRERLKVIGLDSQSTADRIIDIYKTLREK